MIAAPWAVGWRAGARVIAVATASVKRPPSGSRCSEGRDRCAMQYKVYPTWMGSQAAPCKGLHGIACRLGAICGIGRRLRRSVFEPV